MKKSTLNWLIFAACFVFAAINLLSFKIAQAINRASLVDKYPPHRVFENYITYYYTGYTEYGGEVISGSIQAYSDDMARAQMNMMPHLLLWRGQNYTNGKVRYYRTIVDNRQ